MELFEQLVSGQPTIGLDWKPEFVNGMATIIGADGKSVSGQIASVDSYDALSIKHLGGIGEVQFAVTRRAGDYRTIAFRSGPEGKPEGAVAVGYSINPEGELYVLGLQEKRHLCCVDHVPQLLFTPAGGWTDLSDKTALETAQRELAEEMGLTNVAMRYAGKFLPNRAINVSDDGMNMTEVYAFRIPWENFYLNNDQYRLVLPAFEGDAPTSSRKKLRKSLANATAVTYDEAIASFDGIAVAACAKTEAWIRKNKS